VAAPPPAPRPTPAPPPIPQAPSRPEVPPASKEPVPQNGNQKKPIQVPVVSANSIPEESPPDFETAESNNELPSGYKEIGAVFFYPGGKEKELETVHRKFQEVIKKHKLKFRLKRVYSHGYQVKGKINYTSFVDVCKQNKVPVAIVIGPPPEALLPEQDFYDLLSVTLDVQGVSLQLVSWNEIDKDYRYLNLALDIALVRSR
jgi:hypothetical protein